MVWGQEGRSTPAGGERHRVREIGIVVSWGGSGEQGWRTELELGSRKSLDDHHGAATLGTEPKRVPFLAKGRFWSRRWLHCVECLKAKRQESDAPAVGEEAKVANADKAFGEQNATGSGAGTHRGIGSSTCVDFCERSRANER